MEEDVATKLYKKKLIAYVKFNLNKGISLDAIKSKLIQSNISPILIAEIISSVTTKKPPNNNLIIISIVMILLISGVVSYILFFSNPSEFKIELEPNRLSVEEENISSNLVIKARESRKIFNFFESINFFKEALEHNPNDYSIYTNLGYSYLFVGMFNESKESFLKAYNLIQGESDTIIRPNAQNSLIQPGVQTGLAYIYILEKDFDQADRMIIEALEYEENKLDLYLFLSNAFFEINMSEKAMDLLKMAQEDYPDNLYINREKAYFSYDLRDYDSAEKYANEDYSKDENSIKANLVIGLLNYNYHDDTTMAKPYLEKYVELTNEPNLANDAYNVLARIYLLENDINMSVILTNEVIEYYETSVFNYSKDPDRYFREKLVYEDALAILEEIEDYSS
jgi:tetratricopeptide (TPR) repeat protein